MQNHFALSVIDMQLVAFDGRITPPIRNGQQLLDRVKTLIEVSRSNQIPIVFVQTCALSGRPYAKDVHGWEIHPSIAPQPDDRIVYKSNSDGFDGTNLKEVLSALGARGVIVCGIWSEFCVTRTCMSALELGFDVYVAADAHGTVATSDDAGRVVISRQNDYLQHNGAHVSEVQHLQELLAPHAKPS